MPTRFLPLPLLLATLLAAAALAGCGDALPTAQNATSVQEAVAQQYDAERVEATLHQVEDTPRLEIVLANPSGQEATNRQVARNIARTAQTQYESGALDTVMVSFEYTSQAGPAEVGFHRRYTFSSDDLQAVADTTASDASSTDTSAAGQTDTSAIQP